MTVSAVLATALVAAPSRAVDPACGTSAGYAICLDVPSGPLAGEVAVSVRTNGGGLPSRMEFLWTPPGGAPERLFLDLKKPFGFVWPTTKYLDGEGSLSARAVVSGTAGTPVSVPAQLANGNLTGIRWNPSDHGSRFSPVPPGGSDPLTAAVGDGAAGTPATEKVADAIRGRSPNLFLYLGDVYETGTFGELRTNYGLPRPDDPAGVGTSWARMSTITAPTLGNHEDRVVLRDYWHGWPDYTSFDFGGVHYVDLNTQCKQVPCKAGGAQHAWLKSDLAGSTLRCVVGFWHIPPVGGGKEDARQAALWRALVGGGADLVITAHRHAMEEFAPLNAAFQAGAPDSHTVLLVSGAGGYAMKSGLTADPRRVWKAEKVAGAVWVRSVDGASGVATSLSWRFEKTDGTLLRAGSVGC